MTTRTLLLALPLCLLGGPAFAQAGFYLPTAPTSYGQDEFRAADGTSCRSSMDGTKRVEVGAFGSGGRSDNTYYSLPGYSYPAQGNAGVYGRFSMSLDASPERMNCNALYRLELERRTLELELMKRSLVEADRRLDDIKQSRSAEPQQQPAPAPARLVSAKQVADKHSAAKPAKARKVASAAGYPPP